MWDGRLAPPLRGGAEGPGFRLDDARRRRRPPCRPANRTVAAPALRAARGVAGGASRLLAPRGGRLRCPHRSVAAYGRDSSRARLPGRSRRPGRRQQCTSRTRQRRRGVRCRPFPTSTAPTRTASAIDSGRRTAQPVEHRPPRRPPRDGHHGPDPPGLGPEHAEIKARVAARQQHHESKRPGRPGRREGWSPSSPTKARPTLAYRGHSVGEPRQRAQHGSATRRLPVPRSPRRRRHHPLAMSCGPARASSATAHEGCASGRRI